MKKLILFVLLIAVQTSNAQIKFYLTGNMGATVNFWKPEPFNQFVASYNNDAGLAPLIKTPLSDFSGTAVGYSRGFGAMVEWDKTIMGFEYNKCAFNQTSASTFTNNNGREITLRFVTWNFNFDISRKFGKRVDFGLLFGVSQRGGRVFSYATYANSSNRSVGPEFWINGIYKGITENDFNLGLSLRVNFLKYLALQVRAYRSFAWAKPKEGEEYLEAFSDGSPGKNLFSEYFPKDFTLFEDNVQAQNYDYQNNVIPNIFTGWYLNTSLIVKLPLGKNK